jgi:hypothetical protein
LPACQHLLAHPHLIDHVPVAPDWLHEIKYDDYRRRLERDGNRARMITVTTEPTATRGSSKRRSPFEQGERTKMKAKGK